MPGNASHPRRYAYALTRPPMQVQAALRERDLPSDLHKRILAYFNYSFQKVGGDEEKRHVGELPYDLRVRPCTHTQG